MKSGTAAWAEGVADAGLLGVQNRFEKQYVSALPGKARIAIDNDSNGVRSQGRSPALSNHHSSIINGVGDAIHSAGGKSKFSSQDIVGSSNSGNINVNSNSTNNNSHNSSGHYDLASGAARHNGSIQEDVGGEQQQVHKQIRLGYGGDYGQMEDGLDIKNAPDSSNKGHNDSDDADSYIEWTNQQPSNEDMAVDYTDDMYRNDHYKNTYSNDDGGGDGDGDGDGDNHDDYISALELADSVGGLSWERSVIRGGVVDSDAQSPNEYPNEYPDESPNESPVGAAVGAAVGHDQGKRLHRMSTLERKQRQKPATFKKRVSTFLKSLNTRSRQVRLPGPSPLSSTVTSETVYSTPASYSSHSRSGVVEDRQMDSVPSQHGHITNTLNQPHPPKPMLSSMVRKLSLSKSYSHLPTLSQSSYGGGSLANRRIKLGLGIGRIPNSGKSNVPGTTTQTPQILFGQNHQRHLESQQPTDDLLQSEGTISHSPWDSSNSRPTRHLSLSRRLSDSSLASSTAVSLMRLENTPSDQMEDRPFRPLQQRIRDLLQIPDNPDDFDDIDDEKSCVSVTLNDGSDYHQSITLSQYHSDLYEEVPAVHSNIHLNNNSSAGNDHGHLLQIPHTNHNDLLSPVQSESHKPVRPESRSTTKSVTQSKAVDDINGILDDVDAFVQELDPSFHIISDHITLERMQRRYSVSPDLFQSTQLPKIRQDSGQDTTFSENGDDVVENQVFNREATPECILTNSLDLQASTRRSEQGSLDLRGDILHKANIPVANSTFEGLIPNDVAQNIGSVAEIPSKNTYSFCSD
ncbi:hypothetical protein BSLG_004022 [Batrachochytrium salamandrivorans]|nr:hypothetical protein BSLG_004022 [Batrachochytrium salamandrivorans]